MKLRTLTLCILALALALPTFAGPVNPGKWQVTLTTEMPNMPVKMPPMSFTYCISKEEAENPQPPKSKHENGCTVSDYKMDGNVVTWSVKCTGKNEMSGTGKMVLNGDTYEGETHMKTGDMEINQKMSGKLLGACDAK
jgi:hypothetical protein